VFTGARSLLEDPRFFGSPWPPAGHHGEKTVLIAEVRGVHRMVNPGARHLSPLSKCPLSVHDEPKGEGTRWSRLGDYLGNTKGYERVGCPGKDS
jgi:hypothetical protein